MALKNRWTPKCCSSAECEPKTLRAPVANFIKKKKKENHLTHIGPNVISPVGKRNQFQSTQMPKLNMLKRVSHDTFKRELVCLLNLLLI